MAIIFVISLSFAAFKIVEELEDTEQKVEDNKLMLEKNTMFAQVLQAQLAQLKADVNRMEEHLLKRFHSKVAEQSPSYSM